MSDCAEQPIQDRFEELFEAYRDAVEQGDVEAQESIGAECLMLASEHAEICESENLRLTLEAREHEEAARWPEAEAAHRRALALAETENDDWAAYKAHADLSALYDLLGQGAKALEEAQAAVEAARKVDLNILLSMALNLLARSLLSANDPRGALGVAEESVRVCGDDRMYDLPRARALVLRARCTIEVAAVGGDGIASALADLDRAWDLLAPVSQVPLFAGVQSMLAGWWEVTAQLRKIECDDPAAAHARGKAVEFRRRVSEAPQCEGPYLFNQLAEALHQHGLALLATGDSDGAASASAESRAIRQRLGLPASSTEARG